MEKIEFIHEYYSKSLSLRGKGFEGIGAGDVDGCGYVSGAGNGANNGNSYNAFFSPEGSEDGCGCCWGSGDGNGNWNGIYKGK